MTELLTETLVPTTTPRSPTTTTRSTYRVLPQEAGCTKNYQTKKLVPVNKIIVLKFDIDSFISLAVMVILEKAFF